PRTEGQGPRTRPALGLTPEAPDLCPLRPFSAAPIPRQAAARELPPGVGGEEIPIGRADVGARRGARAAPQDDLVAHELAVVLPQGPRGRPVAGVGDIRA